MTKRFQQARNIGRQAKRIRGKKGWFKESLRHSLARRGISTKKGPPSGPTQVAYLGGRLGGPSGPDQPSFMYARLEGPYGPEQSEDKILESKKTKKYIIPFFSKVSKFYGEEPLYEEQPPWYFVQPEEEEPSLVPVEKSVEKPKSKRKPKPTHLFTVVEGEIEQPKKKKKKSKPKPVKPEPEKPIKVVPIHPWPSEPVDEIKEARRARRRMTRLEREIDVVKDDFKSGKISKNEMKTKEQRNLKKMKRLAEIAKPFDFGEKKVKRQEYQDKKFELLDNSKKSIISLHNTLKLTDKEKEILNKEIKTKKPKVDGKPKPMQRKKKKVDTEVAA